MRKTGLAIALALLTPAIALAQPVESRAAKKMLFSERGAEVVVADVDFLDDSAKTALKQAAGQIPYYGAIAVSPGEPTSANLMSTMANFHTSEAASAAALANCNARRTSGGPCVVIATVLPKRYRPEALTMSLQATQAFNKQYRKMKEPKGMAISPTVGAYGYDRGDGGRAISICNAAAAREGASDCRLVVADQ
ncbi:5-aminolevulic acid synthase [Tropicimonas sp.]|uniref:5-aminolevulic acid synthase n=1 Tax=Tropicimonas sp. TaxID=2067044 RepID=UPI003A86FAFC